MRVKRETHPNLKLLSKLIAALMVAVFLNGCASKGDLALSKVACTWKLWQGNPAKAGVTRLDALAPILATDDAFSKFTCLTADDLRNLLTCGGEGK